MLSFVIPQKRLATDCTKVWQHWQQTTASQQKENTYKDKATG